MSKILPGHAANNFDDELRNFIFEDEGGRSYVYACSEGVPTIGYGTALLVKSKGKWVWRGKSEKGLALILGKINKTLTVNDKNLLNKVADILNKNIGKSGNMHRTKETIGITGGSNAPGQSNFDLSLTKPEAITLFNITITEYIDWVRQQFINAGRTYGKTKYNNIAKTEEMKHLTDMERGGKKISREMLAGAIHEGRLEARLGRIEDEISDGNFKLKNTKLTNIFSEAGKADGLSVYNELKDKKEIIALVSMAYNGFGRVGEALTEIIMENKREEAYQYIRDNSGGSANRRQKEANMFNGTHAVKAVEWVAKAAKAVFADISDLYNPQRFSLFTTDTPDPYRFYRISQLPRPAGAYIDKILCTICPNLHGCTSFTICPHGVIH